MVAVPALTGVTTPLAATVTFVLLLAQVTTWFVAMLGTTVAIMTAGAPPAIRDNIAWFRVTPVTGAFCPSSIVKIQSSLFGLNQRRNLKIVGKSVYLGLQHSY